MIDKEETAVGEPMLISVPTPFVTYTPWQIPPALPFYLVSPQQQIWYPMYWPYTATSMQASW